MDDIWIGILLAVGQFVLVGVLALLNSDKKKPAVKSTPTKEAAPASTP